MKTRAHLTLVNELETSAMDIADRGLAYGDGLFETLRVIDGKIPLLDYHLERLKRGVAVLGLGKPDTVVAQFRHYVDLALKDLTKVAHLKRAIIKVILTRGQGGRGYTPPSEPILTFVTQVFEYPKFPDSNWETGISLHLCEHRLSHQPVLAGIKHLNRLDQVLASNELSQAECEEGLLLDYQGNVIEGTKSNLLIIDGNKVITPKLDGAGVAGTLRQYLIEQSASIGIEFVEKRVCLADVKTAEGLAVVNSVLGLWPVKEFSGKSYAAHKICGMIQSHLKTRLFY